MSDAKTAITQYTIFCIFMLAAMGILAYKTGNQYITVINPPATLDCHTDLECYNLTGINY